MQKRLAREIVPPKGSTMTVEQYSEFLAEAFTLMQRCPQYASAEEDVDCLELAHLLPAVPETVLAVYLGINDAVCNKGLVAPFLVRHGHNNVFVFDPDVYSGDDGVPSGTIDASAVLSGFEPPNETWNPGWTYVMIEDPLRSFESLWRERGYIDMIPAKFEDFTMLSDPETSRVCFFIDRKAFDHPVNQGREYLKAAIKRGERTAGEYALPKGLEGEVDGLVPVALDRGQKLYVATRDFGPCEHAWNNIHPENKEWAVVNENSAIPLDLVVAKPPANPRLAKGLRSALGSADMTTDWFHRGREVVRTPLLQGLIKG
ncbi:MAG: hypothetical protein HYX78_07270 [Armatimonadetes bacterium]|nr:hypothetical protein [Armatimonadota bacterium]